MKPEVVHGLKIWPHYFEAVRNGTKTFEYRVNDRDYQVGDILHLQEWDDITRKYTGRELRMEVTYVLELRDEMCILGIRKEEDASVGELLRELVEAWELSVERWWQNHDSIPTAFVQLAVAIEKVQRIMRGEMGKEEDDGDDAS